MNEFKIKKGLIVQGSGSLFPILDIQGSQGELFSVTDNLSGSLSSVNDISGLPIFEVFSDDTVKIGTYNAEGLIVSGSNIKVGRLSTNIHTVTGSLNISGSLSVTPGVINSLTSSFAMTASFAATSSYSSGSGLISNAVSASYALTASYVAGASSFPFTGTAVITGSLVVTSTLTLDQTLTDYATVNSSIVGANNLFTQATGSYTSAFFKYTTTNGTNARSGETMAVWNGTTTQFTDNSTLDIGDTSGVTVAASIITSDLQFNITTTTSGWKIKSLATFM